MKGMPVFKIDCGLPVPWSLIMQGEVPCETLVLLNTSSLAQPLGLLPADTRVTKCLLPVLFYSLKGFWEEVGAGLCFEGFYPGLVLQVSHEPHLHPLVEQRCLPSVAAAVERPLEACVVES